MPGHTDQVLELLDAGGRQLGQVHVEGIEGNLVQGRFAAGPAFAAVEVLFQSFEDAVNAQALSVADELGASIDRLGLRIRTTAGGPPAAIRDVQIWSDGGVSLRLTSTQPVNGALPIAAPAQRTHS